MGSSDFIVLSTVKFHDVLGTWWLRSSGHLSPEDRTSHDGSQSTVLFPVHVGLSLGFEDGPTCEGSGTDVCLYIKRQF